MKSLYALFWLSIGSSKATASSHASIWDLKSRKQEYQPYGKLHISVPPGTALTAPTDISEIRMGRDRKALFMTVSHPDGSGSGSFTSTIRVSTGFTRWTKVHKGSTAKAGDELFVFPDDSEHTEPTTAQVHMAQYVGGLGFRHAVCQFLPGTICADLPVFLPYIKIDKYPMIAFMVGQATATTQAMNDAHVAMVQHIRRTFQLLHAVAAEEDVTYLRKLEGAVPPEENRLYGQGSVDDNRFFAAWWTWDDVLKRLGNRGVRDLSKANAKFRGFVHQRQRNIDYGFMPIRRLQEILERLRPYASRTNTDATR